MRAQILLIAMLVWGPVGSALCEARCARASGSAYAEAEMPANPPPCHASGGPAHGSRAPKSGCSGAICSCAAFERAAVAAMPPRAPGFVAFAAVMPTAVPGLQPVRGAILRLDPPERPSSPYLHRNPPLLI